MKLARAAAEAGLDGLAFYRGIPGSVGGALRMNAGAHGGETTDVLVDARAVDRAGALHVLSHAEMGFAYRHCAAPADLIFTQATYRGRPGDRAAIEAEMDRVTAAREAAQPIRERTGGSTFKNPPGGKAWQLVDAAGCRGLTRGGAQVSEMHCNFLINRGGASRRRHRGPGRGGAGAGARDLRHRPALGDQADRRARPLIRESARGAGVAAGTVTIRAAPAGRDRGCAPPRAGPRRGRGRPARTGM